MSRNYMGAIIRQSSRRLKYCFRKVVVGRSRALADLLNVFIKTQRNHPQKCWNNDGNIPSNCM